MTGVGEAQAAKKTRTNPTNPIDLSVLSMPLPFETLQVNVGRAGLEPATDGL